MHIVHVELYVIWIYKYIYNVNCLHLCLQNCCLSNFTKAMMKTYEKHLGCSFLAPPIYYYDSFDHGTTPQMHPNAASLKVSEAQFPSVLRNNSIPVLMENFPVSVDIYGKSPWITVLQDVIYNHSYWFETVGYLSSPSGMITLKSSHSC